MNTGNSSRIQVIIGRLVLVFTKQRLPKSSRFCETIYISEWFIKSILSKKTKLFLQSVPEKSKKAV